MTEVQRTTNAAPEATLNAEQQQALNTISKMTPEFRVRFLGNLGAQTPQQGQQTAETHATETPAAAPAAPAVPEQTAHAPTTGQAHTEEHPEAQPAQEHPQEQAAAGHGTDQGNTATETKSTSALHPAALTGKQKLAALGAVGGVAALGALAASSVPLLPTVGLTTSVAANAAYAGLQAGVATIPYLGLWAPAAYAGIQSGLGAIPYLGAAAPVLGGIASTAILAPVAAAGLYGLGKVSNWVTQGALGIFGKSHESTGFGLRKNLWYGAKALTSPIWGTWEALKWGRRKTIQAGSYVGGKVSDSWNWMTQHKWKFAGGLTLASLLAMGGWIAATPAAIAGVAVASGTAAAVIPEKNGNGHAAAGGDKPKEGGGAHPA